MKKIAICLLFGLLVVVGLCFQVGRYSKKQASTPNTGEAVYRGTPSFPAASSTWYTITSTSVRILATSTPTKRVAATVQAVNCTTGTTLYVSTNDLAAVAGQGLAVYASTTLQMTDYPELPSVQGSMRAITGVGTCTVLVNEWRTQY
jgi:hypothetical protein